jgi:nicotinamide-nucleotide amidase
MNACIVSIGDELLIGQTINTNAGWIGEQLNLIGVDVIQTLAISDKENEIIRALDESGALADVVIITGGLGPTKDDITKYTLCKYFDTKLELNQDVLERIKDYFAKRNREMLEVNVRQAEIPVGCRMIVNNNGTAQGMWFERNNTIFVSMPGVPFEMKGMMTETILPELAQKNKSKIVHRTLLTTGIGESFLADKIAAIETDLRNDGLSLAYLPSPGLVKLRVTAKGEDKASMQRRVDHFCERIIKETEKHYFGEGSNTLENIVSELLKTKKQTLGAVESCTGGNIGRLITSVPGASDLFNGTITAYAYSVKESVLGLDHDTLVKEGAVSEWCAIELAKNGRRILGTDFCVSTTGVAGPGGGSELKPVGTIWIGFSSAEKTYAKKFLFGPNRNYNILKASATALNMLRLELLGKI